VWDTSSLVILTAYNINTAVFCKTKESAGNIHVEKNPWHSFEQGASQIEISGAGRKVAQYNAATSACHGARRVAMPYGMRI
jgi:hypothetical protein